MLVGAGGFSGRRRPTGKANARRTGARSINTSNRDNVRPSAYSIDGDWCAIPPQPNTFGAGSFEAFNQNVQCCAQRPSKGQVFDNHTNGKAHNLLTTQTLDDDKYLAICKHYTWGVCGVMAHDDLHTYMHLPGRLGNEGYKKFTWLRPNHPTSPCLWITKCRANRSQPPIFVWRSLADVKAEVQQENHDCKEESEIYEDFLSRAP